MRILIAVLVTLLATMSATAGYAQQANYVTRVYVDKSERVLHLMNGERVLRTYNIDLGFAPEGHKRFEGDGRTPEGLYYVTHRNPRSAFHKSLGISYPNARDRARARAAGRSPGGDIYIHGRAPRNPNPAKDWTLGCLAVTNAQMDEIYRYVAPGTPIYIAP
jgi:murein L,D-transpeptidase YafK